MTYLGMPFGMWALFAPSFRKQLTAVLGYDAATARAITKKAKPQYRQIIAGLPEFEKAGRRTARRGRRRGPRPGQGVSRGRCGRVAARKQELRPTQNTDLTKYNLRVCCTAP